MTTWSHTIEALAASVSRSACRAVDEYPSSVNAIVSERSRNFQHIERTLDGGLDFSFDPGGVRDLCNAVALGYYLTFTEPTK